MPDKLSANELKWLRGIAVADSNVDNRIPQLSLARLLKFGLVESRNMLTLRITRRGWKCLTLAAPELAAKRARRPIPYALGADRKNVADLRVEQ